MSCGLQTTVTDPFFFFYFMILVNSNSIYSYWNQTTVAHPWNEQAPRLSGFEQPSVTEAQSLFHFHSPFPCL